MYTFYCLWVKLDFRFVFSVPLVSPLTVGEGEGLSGKIYGCVQLKNHAVGMVGRWWSIRRTAECLIPASVAGVWRCQHPWLKTFAVPWRWPRSSDWTAPNFNREIVRLANIRLRVCFKVATVGLQWRRCRYYGRVLVLRNRCLEQCCQPFRSPHVSKTSQGPLQSLPPAHISSKTVCCKSLIERMNRKWTRWCSVSQLILPPPFLSGSVGDVHGCCDTVALKINAFTLCFPDLFLSFKINI